MGVEDADHLKRVAAAVADGRRTLLAEKLEDLDTFHATRDLGFSLFQGFFFARPEIVPGRKFSSNQVAKLQLLQELGRPDFDVARLTDIIQTDPGLSYRLFRYINSVGFAVRTKVESVTRAITLLGELQIKQWLRVVLMSDLNPSPKTSELTFVSVHRARFLEMLAREAESVDRSPETMFTLGLFSLLDGLMDMPMGEILKNMPLDTVITQAMMERDHPLHLYLELCADYEHGRWLEAFTRLQEIGLDQEIADRLYMDSRLWTAKIMGLAVEDEEEASGDEPENDDPSPAE
jgi:EAL and modified HD-GYP domain-containing signal transduction protein